MWKTAFKKFKVIWSAFLRAVFHKFYLVHSWVFWPILSLLLDVIRISMSSCFPHIDTQGVSYSQKFFFFPIYVSQILYRIPKCKNRWWNQNLKMRKIRKGNIKNVLEKRKRKKDIKIDMMRYLTFKYLLTYFTHTYMLILYNSFITKCI